MNNITKESCPICDGEIVERQVKKFLRPRTFWECLSCHKIYNNLEDFRKAHISKLKNNGIKRFLTGNHKEANEYFDAAIEIDPEDAEIWNFKGSYYLSIKKYEDAIECLDKALKINPNRADCWLNLAGAYDGFGDYKKAINCFDKSIKIKPNRMNWNQKGDIYNYQLKDYKNAIKYYDTALNMPPLGATNSEIWQKKAEAFKGLNKEKKAEECSKKSQEYSAIEFLQQGISLFEQGNNEEAIDFFNKTIKISPKNEDAWGNKALSLMELGKFEQAIFCFDKILEVDPYVPGPWTMKGLIFNEIGKFDDAINCYDKIIEIDKKNAASWHIKGTILQKLERDNDADECFKKAIELGYKIDVKDN